MFSFFNVLIFLHVELKAGSKKIISLKPFPPFFLISSCLFSFLSFFPSPHHLFQSRRSVPQDLAAAIYSHSALPFHSTCSFIEVITIQLSPEGSKCKIQSAKNPGLTPKLPYVEGVIQCLWILW